MYYMSFYNILKFDDVWEVIGTPKRLKYGRNQSLIKTKIC